MVALKKVSPLILALAVLWAVVFVILNASISKTGGRLIYALDDAYIHMAMSKNLAEHGVWGVTRHEFSSTSSSLAWTLLLSLFYTLFGVGEATPFIFNFFLATVLVVFLFYVLDRFALSPTQKMLWLLAFVAIVPLPYLIFGGLEHVLQHLINLLYVAAAAAVLAGDRRPAVWDGILLLVFSCLAVLIRFEGLFFVFIVSVLLLFRKRFLFAVLNGMAAALPLVIYGLISLQKGWYFLPSSVLLKGYKPDFSTLKGVLGFLYLGSRQLVYNIHILVLVVAVLFMAILFMRREKRFWEKPLILASIFLATTLTHMFFARSGYFLNRVSQIRYDAYLVTLGLFTLLHLVAANREARVGTGRSAKWAGALLAVFLLLPLLEWGVQSNRQVVRASHNIYSQQYQMGLFLKQFYQGQSVVVNDIGAINFLADIRCFDIWGLASRDIADAVLEKTYTGAEISRLARLTGAGIAIVYDYPFYFKTVGGIPSGWMRVAQWTIPDNVICAADTVSFYALDPSEIPRLTACLRRFSPQLPREVRERGGHLR